MIVIILSIIALAIVSITDLVTRIPVGESLISIDCFRLLGHGAPSSWWFLSVYVRGWGLDIYYNPEPYWGCLVGRTRKAGIWVGGVTVLFYLGPTGREGSVRQVPSRKWYELEMR